MVLKKSKIDNKVLFVDASKECKKVTNNNKLEQKNIDNILEYYTKRENIDYISKIATRAEIEEQGYNLSVSSYVELEDTREKIDITLLNAQIKEIVAKEDILRAEIDKIIAEIEG